MLSCGIFARDDSLNAPRLFELYFLSGMMNSDKIDHMSFLARQIYGTTVSIVGRIVIGGFITTIVGSLRVELNPED